MRFINRVVTNPNRKTLNVQDITYNQNTGEISSLVVDEVNNDGPVITEGTKLNATNLNNILDSISRDYFCYLYYKEIYGLIISDEKAP